LVEGSDQIDVAEDRGTSEMGRKILQMRDRVAVWHCHAIE